MNCGEPEGRSWQTLRANLRSESSAKVEAATTSRCRQATTCGWRSSITFLTSAAITARDRRMEMTESESSQLFSV